MALSVPFFEQKNEYYCGPATLQMVFDYFNVNIPQDEIARAAHTSHEHGTKNKNLVRAATEKGFYCYVNENATIEEIKYFLSKELPVIVDFIDPEQEEGHFAVISNIKSGIITMNDPWNGKGIELSVDEFLPRWHNGFEKGKHWILVVSDKAFELGTQYAPQA